MDQDRKLLSRTAPLDSMPPLMERFLKLNASDLHVSSDDTPFVRINGDLVPMPDEPMLKAAEVGQLARTLLGEERFARFEQEQESDLAISLSTGQRIRINASMQRGSIALAIRLLSSNFIQLEELGISRRIISNICALRHGLVIVTGATGSGKSTTLASFINELNISRQAHIVTIEEPIEYIHKSDSSYVTQREVGTDTKSFSEALRRSFRQDPDIVLIGELRDQETIRAALTLSETGHLTFGTLHTSEAFQTVIRIIGAFPPSEQERARLVLANTLRVVICQQLLPRDDGNGRVLATETMIVNSAIRTLINENKLNQIPTMIKTGGALGMSTMNQSLAKRVREHMVSQDVACAFSPDKEDLLEEILYRG
ncbi:MAG: PilT/PilU family type 4a pilus ATPase [Opitutales bacterium]|jgi:twitching motility protein PilT